MREFFKAELKRLHITTGLQQYFKMSDRPEEITMLLDELVSQCEKFPLIPDDDKKKLIQEFMITDAEFIGFNKKILYKWFNLVNRNYIESQSQFHEDPNHVPAPPEIADKYIAQWIEELNKVGTAGLSDQEKETRLKDMKEQVEGNRSSRIEEMRVKYGVSRAVRERIAKERLSQGTSKLTETDLTPDL